MGDCHAAADFLVQQRLPTDDEPGPEHPLSAGFSQPLVRTGQTRFAAAAERFAAGDWPLLQAQLPSARRG